MKKLYSCHGFSDSKALKKNRLSEMKFIIFLLLFFDSICIFHSFRSFSVGFVVLIHCLRQTNVIFVSMEISFPVSRRVFCFFFLIFSLSSFEIWYLSIECLSG